MPIHLRFFVDRDHRIHRTVFAVIEPYYGKLFQTNPGFHGGGRNGNRRLVVSCYRKNLDTLAGLRDHCHLVDLLSVLHWRDGDNDIGLSTRTRNPSHRIIYGHGKQSGRRRLCNVHHHCRYDLIARGCFPGDIGIFDENNSIRQGYPDLETV